MANGNITLPLLALAISTDVSQPHAILTLHYKLLRGVESEHNKTRTALLPRLQRVCAQGCVCAMAHNCIVRDRHWVTSPYRQDFCQGTWKGQALTGLHEHGSRRLR